jgi:hypothetical protein
MLLMNDSERTRSPHPLGHRTTYLRECELISDSVKGNYFLCDEFSSCSDSYQRTGSSSLSTRIKAKLRGKYDTCPALKAWLESTKWEQGQITPNKTWSNCDLPSPPTKRTSTRFYIHAYPVFENASTNCQFPKSVRFILIFVFTREVWFRESPPDPLNHRIRSYNLII